jgi:hypothetical protein
MIPLGEIDLKNEIHQDTGSAEVRRRGGRRSVRRVYSARIHGCPSNMTVALYQGDTAEEVRSYSDSVNLLWRITGVARGYLTILTRSVGAVQCRVAANELSCRHPNIIQLFGNVSSSNLRAGIFHNGTFFLFLASSPMRSVMPRINTVYTPATMVSPVTSFDRLLLGIYCADATSPCHHCR